MSDPVKPRKIARGPGQYGGQPTAPAPARANPRARTVIDASGIRPPPRTAPLAAPNTAPGRLPGTPLFNTQGTQVVDARDFPALNAPVPPTQVHGPPVAPPNVVDMHGDRHPLVAAVIQRLAPIVQRAQAALAPAPAPPHMGQSPSEAIAGLSDPRRRIQVGDAPDYQLPPTSVAVPAAAQAVPFAAQPTTDRGQPIQDPRAAWEQAVMTAVGNGTISIEDAQRLMTQASGARP